MDAYHADIQRPDTNWLRTTRKAIAVGALVAAMISPASKTSAAASEQQPTTPAESCQWSNKDGQRQPPVNVSPVTVRVDGSCDPDPSAPIGIYPTAKQEGNPTDIVNTNDKLTVQCYVSNGEPIQDARDDITQNGQHIASSNVWLKVRTPRGITGEVSETWAGFPGIATLSSLGIRECTK